MQPRKPRSEKQIEASRKNGARSRGPVTPAGKANSGRNSSRHGLLSKAVVLKGESRRRFQDIIDRLNSSLNPDTDIDHLLIGRMAAAHWRQIRLWETENSGVSNVTPTDKSLETRLDRQFMRNLNGYLRLRTVQPPISDPTNPATI